jgi:hypothetical protein
MIRVLLSVPLLLALLTGAARAEPVKCRGAISAASAAYLQARAKTLQKCREAVTKGAVVLGPSEICATRPKVAATLAKAAAKLDGTIAKACGGANKTCNAGDTGRDADDTPASVGFGGTCPNLEQGVCDAPITDCGDVVACMRCIADHAVDQALGLSYDLLLPTSAKSKDKGEKLLNKCQVGIGKAATKLMLAQSKILTGCRKKANKAGTGDCPDAAATAKIVAARATLATALAKACGGADKTIGNGDDTTPAEIGFPTTCMNDAVPSCAGGVATLTQLAGCVDCIASFKAECADAAAIPAFAAPYPAKCNAGVAPPTIFTLNAVASGAYTDQGTHFPDNYAVGWYANSNPGNVEVRDYFVFDLSPLTGTIVSAFLRVSTAPPGFIRYGGNDPSETFTLFAVASTPITTLVNGTGNGGSAFTDLGAGTSYGSRVVTPNPGPIVDVSLNGSGVAYLQANTNGLVVMGGAITTLAKAANDDEFLFNATTAAQIRQLVVATVE